MHRTANKMQEPMEKQKLAQGEKPCANENVELPSMRLPTVSRAHKAEQTNKQTKKQLTKPTTQTKQAKKKNILRTNATKELSWASQCPNFPSIAASTA